ncbi:MAG: MraY family glycosyltransferase [Candidatus Sericytochromatia bacterium]
MFYYLILTLILSLSINLFIINNAKKNKMFLDPVSGEKKQSFHKNATPRAGGISIYLSALFLSPFVSNDLFINILCFLPSFVYGVYEDIYGDTPQKNRLAVMSLSTIAAMYFTGVTIKSAGFFDIPVLLQYPLTVIGAIGIASAINFIDGLNGLASGVSLMAFLGIGLAALMGGNHELAYSMFLLSFSIIGFMAFNYPFGKIFLGDAGAYFLGYALAISAEYLAYNGPQTSEVSPWFLVALLGYPIIETLYTIVRRYYRLKREKIKFFEAETVHLHSLMYLNVTKNNCVASFVILAFFAMTTLLAFQFRDSHYSSIGLFIATYAVYLASYKVVKNFDKLKIKAKTFLFPQEEKKLSSLKPLNNKKALTGSIK